MGETTSQRPSQALLRAQRWYPPTMVVAGLIMSLGIMPWPVPRGWAWAPMLGSVAALGLLVWWMTTRRATPENGGAYVMWAYAGFMVLRLVTTMATDALGGAAWLEVIGSLVCALPFFGFAWLVGRRLKGASRRPEVETA